MVVRKIVRFKFSILLLVFFFVFCGEVNGIIFN